MAHPIPRLPSDDRLTTFPVGRPDVFRWFEKSMHTYWTPNEVKMDKDATDYETKLAPQMRHFIDYILAFFASADGLVNFNIATRFREEIDIIEVSYFYDFQMTMENIHALTYSMLLDEIIKAQEAKTRLLDAVKTIPVIGKITAFMSKCINSDAIFAERLLRFACVEGIFFQGCFCGIFWLKKRGLMPGLVFSNEQISRDEKLHTEFACYLYNMLSEKLTRKQVIAVLDEAVAVADAFIIEALPPGIPDMNAALMLDYIKCQGDELIFLIGEEPHYGVSHQFDFMNQINMANHTDFFERRVSEYSKETTQAKGDFDMIDDI
jgi:ribonucleotide reductase beta subunit family protein with ferritin-like domain